MRQDDIIRILRLIQEAAGGQLATVSKKSGQWIDELTKPGYVGRIHCSECNSHDGPMYYQNNHDGGSEFRCEEHKDEPVKKRNYTWSPGTGEPEHAQDS